MSQLVNIFSEAVDGSYAQFQSEASQMPVWQVSWHRDISRGRTEGQRFLLLSEVCRVNRERDPIIPVFFALLVTMTCRMPSVLRCVDILSSRL